MPAREGDLGGLCSQEHGQMGSRDARWSQSRRGTDERKSARRQSMESGGGVNSTLTSGPQEAIARSIGSVSAAAAAASDPTEKSPPAAAATTARTSRRLAAAARDTFPLIGPWREGGNEAAGVSTSRSASALSKRKAKCEKNKGGLEKPLASLVARIQRLRKRAGIARITGRTQLPEQRRLTIVFVGGKRPATRQHVETRKHGQRYDASDAHLQLIPATDSGVRRIRCEEHAPRRHRPGC